MTAPLAPFHCDITVVVPTFNRIKHLKKLVESLKAQSLGLESFQIVIVDDGSTDGTKQYLEQLHHESSAFIVGFQANQGPAIARNQGVHLAQSAWIAFTDDDCLPEFDWLEKTLLFLKENPDFDGCGGQIRRKNNSWISRYIDYCGAMRHPLNADGTAVYLVTANATYRKAMIERVSGFRDDIHWPGGEDPDLGFRVTALGSKLGYCHAAVIRHQHRDSLGGLYRMSFCHGRGAAMVSQFSSLPSLQNLRIYFRHSRGTAISHLRSTDVSLLLKPVFLLCYLVQAIGLWRGLQFQYSELSSRPAAR